MHPDHEKQEVVSTNLYHESLLELIKQGHNSRQAKRILAKEQRLRDKRLSKN